MILPFTIGQILKDSTLSLAKIKDTLYKKYCWSEVGKACIQKRLVDPQNSIELSSQMMDRLIRL